MLLLRLHFYAGILVAPFLAVAALTGMLFVFTPQLDALAYPQELTVANATGPVRPLSEQVAVARAAHPAGTLAAVIPPADRDATTQVVFSQPGLGEKQHTVYVDGYTAQARGQLTTWYGETPLTTWVDDLHRNLHLGAVGRMYSELAASWLWIITLGGLILWLGRQRGKRRIRRTLAPDLSARGVRRTRGWYAATGVWLVVGLLFLSATGLTWSRFAGGHFDTALTAMKAHAPELDAALPGGAAPTPAGHHGGGTGGAGDPAHIDLVVDRARAAGLTGPIEVDLPADDKSAWTVAQTDRTWPVHYDKIAFDPATDKITARVDWTDWPAMSKLSKLGVQARMGFLFGLVNQLLLAALALGLLCVIVWGYRMWWQRRPTRADRRAPLGTAPERGT